MNFALERSGLTISTLIHDRNQFHYRLLAAGDDDFLTAAGLFDEAGKLGFGFVDGDGFHIVELLVMLAN